ncbi:MAG: hypothetical protein WAK98_16480 [Gemmobacter sp.]
MATVPTLIALLGAASFVRAEDAAPGMAVDCLATADAHYGGGVARGDGVAITGLAAEENRCLGLPPALCRKVASPEACLRAASAAVMAKARDLRAVLPAEIGGDPAAKAAYGRELAGFDAASATDADCPPDGLDAADCQYFNAAMRLSTLRAMAQLARQNPKGE